MMGVLNCGTGMCDEMRCGEPRRLVASMSQGRIVVGLESSGYCSKACISMPSCHIHREGGDCQLGFATCADRAFPAELTVLNATHSPAGPRLFLTTSATTVPSPALAPQHTSPLVIHIVRSVRKENVTPSPGCSRGARVGLGRTEIGGSVDGRGRVELTTC